MLLLLLLRELCQTWKAMILLALTLQRERANEHDKQRGVARVYRYVPSTCTLGSQLVYGSVRFCARPVDFGMSMLLEVLQLVCLKGLFAVHICPRRGGCASLLVVPWLCTLTSIHMSVRHSSRILSFFLQARL